MLRVLCAMTAALLGQQPGAMDRAELAKLVAAGWPTRGSLTCEYRVAGLPGHWRKRVSYHFPTGAWCYWHADGKNGSSGMTPDGRFYAGEARLEFQSQVHSDASASLDPYFPSFALLKHLERAEAVRTVRPGPGGEGYVVECVLPRGQRNQTLDQIPAALVDALGGPQGIMREIEIEVDSALRPVVRRCQGQPDQVYSLSEHSPGGFSVSRTCPWPAQEVELISCIYDPEGPASEFEIQAAQAGLTRWQRTYGDIRTPVGPAIEQKGGVPLPRGSEEDVGLLRRPLPWLLTGGTVVLVGAAAWLRRRVLRA